METISNWNQVVFNSFSAMAQKVMSDLPSLIGAILLVIIGWLLGKLVATLVTKLLHAVKLDNLTDMLDINTSLIKADVNFTPSQIIGKFAYWVIFLLFLITASDTLGWSGVSTSINDLLSYLPKLFSAIVVFVLGFYIATIVRKALTSFFISTRVPAGMAISMSAYYVILVIITLTALNQAGVDTTVITANLSIILGGLVVAFALSFGLGSKEILSNIIAAYYLRGIFHVGQSIKVGEHAGEIVKIEKTTVTIKSEYHFTVIPSRKFSEEAVVIKL
ncbi:MAG: mechanosensitive ion channel [Cyclobacteriaceae bacterium]|nr:mechanosensitive ion channel [Cyclobacteriaceae bacterium]